MKREREIKESLCVNTMSFKEVQTKKTMNSHKRLRENRKGFCFFFFNKKKLPHFRKTHDFHDWGESPTSRQGKPPKHSKSKLWKNFLSVFRDWKVYPRGSRKLSRENLCVPLVTRPFTREQVAKPTRELTVVACDLDGPWLSRQNRATQFLKFFFSFCKNKILSKNT